MNHASIYCKSLHRVTKAELVNALHQSLMQLKAQQSEDRQKDSCGIYQKWDHQPAIAEASRIMAKAGHIGFTA